MRTRWLLPLLLATALLAGALPASAQPAPPPPSPGTFVPLQAARLFDSRVPTRVVDRGFTTAGPLGPGRTVSIPVAGRGGVPDTGAGTVVLNITGTTLFGSSYMTLWPQDAPRPPTSTLSLTSGAPVTKTVVTKLGGGGAVSLFNVTGLTDATVDVVGWFPENSPLASGVPQRVLDARAGAEGVLQPGEQRRVAIDGRGFAAAPPGSAVLVSLTGTDASRPTTVSAWGTGGPRPFAPQLTLVPGDTLPNMTIVPVGDDGSITVANEAGTVEVLADLVAVVPAAVGKALTPARLYDSRAPDATTAAVGTGPLTPGRTRTVPVLGRSGVPTTGVSSVLLNVTGLGPAGTGAIGVWGAGPPPSTSAVVVPAGTVRPGFAVVPVSPQGTVQVAAAGSAMDVVLDVVGFLAGTPGAAPGVPAPTTGGPAPDGGKLLWQADFTRGLANYRSTPWNMVGAAPPGVVGSVLGGLLRKPALQVSMPGGGQRAELEPNFRSLRNGDDLFFGFSVTLAPGFPVDTGDWQVITQWKNEGTGSPPLSVKVGQGQFQLDGGFDRGAPFEIPMGAATPGRAQQVVVHVRFAEGGGSVDTWVDGKQTIRGFRPPAGTLYPGTTSYLKTGIYRSTAIGQAGTLFFDDWRIGTSYAAAYPR
ncbi:heparin lyase I family protein [Actinomycetospora termitidis]|uniref:Heparin lyase I family protein n=1 Tax=Actinomycetospora termitidis TaxID=3053470 RepID=A0ABT7M3B1_9PSEU|nr:heparin lyase I family protein [Actinomycetospora sp. Odt1-22]MDL5154694.1 heparin lyase I family protein [Actinomycetospora sp. Odt1-22]